MSLKQQHFDIAYRSVIAQGKPSVTKKGTCRYRSRDGSKCAFGFLLKDEDYRPAMDPYEGMIASKVIKQYELIGFDPDLRFYDELQSCHDLAACESDGDNARFIERYKRRMTALAAEFNLTVPGDEAAV